MTKLVRFPSPLTAPLSKAVKAGDFLFLSGQTPKTPDLTPLRGDIREQSINVLDAITASLAEHGLDLSSVVRATVWLSDIKLMAPFNEVYRSYFENHLPVRSTIEAKLSQEVDVEIEVTAWAPHTEGQ
ncbi:endoribonuclease L-PSP family protein 6 (plasmid) [Cupriavidus necator N-1]|uniref:Endoribonuclease L-PSP family protein 6 n=1 Tax=Cupriavidus necator (strain ATCC 43291 / DSM 13513 / CCUG 52238 / LMG 8453 / N-1) TaxID=1042878 RepID=F8GUN5_CUPNN|nr:RidA family protein [Cupriavidus necator]AEI82439.1 endoribonuclease L-PSP family protein 6 [Cupriavidus necator N-1]MDX6007445.1 RidA family protein [Cupriavidus necator]